MIIDRELISDGITPKLLSELIRKNEAENERYIKLMRYYKGEHDILQRAKKSDGAANNKVVCNHAKYITDMVTSYITGNPITYTTAEGYDITPVLEEFSEQDISCVDCEIIKNASIYGRAYELVYADEESKPRSMIIDVKNAFIVNENNAGNKPLFGVYYYKRYNLSGTCIGIVCNVYTDERIMRFTSETEAWESMLLREETGHYFGDVPLIRYKNNNEEQGDFEPYISLIDAYNLLMSDRVNDKEQFVDAFLFLSGIEIDSEQARKLKDERILMGYEGAHAEYLSKVMNEADIEVLRTAIKSDIHRLSMIPDLSDEEFSSNLSGVAIKYKLTGFEQIAKNKERSLTRTLKERLKLYENFLHIKGMMELVPIYRIDTMFARNLPINELEVSQMITNLTDIVSRETLLSQLSFVTDPKDEIKAVKAEREEKQLNRIKEIEEIASGGGF